MEENLGETYEVSQETTMYYCDDEGSWVQLKPFNDVAVIEMIRCAREVPGTDFKRIKVELQQSEISPPAKSPKAKQLKPSFSPQSSFYQYHERSNPTGGSDLLHARKKQLQANDLIIQPATKRVQTRPETRNFMMKLLQVHLQLSGMWKVNGSN